MTIRRFFLWLTFFITTFLISGAFLLFGLIYWMGPMKGYLPELGPFTYPTLVWWYPAVVSGIFSVIYATHKIHSLKCTEIRLDQQHASPEWLEDRLLAFGYLPTERQGVYTAGFRADYWMAPSIKVRQDGSDLVVSGPTFYLRKLMRSYKRATWLKKEKGRLRKPPRK